MAYRLKTNIIKSLNGQTKFQLAILNAFGLTTRETVRRWLRENNPNGPLTSLAAINIIAETLDIPTDLICEQI